MIRSEKIETVTAALFAVQGKLRPIAKDAKNDFTASRFARLETIWQTVLPLLQEAGIYVAALPETVADNTVGVTTLAVHPASGQYIGGTMTVPFSAEAKKSSAQVVGSVVSYARRYGLCALLGIVHDDDDGNMGHAAGAGSRPQAARPVQRQPQRPAQAQRRRPDATPDQLFDRLGVPIEARQTLYDAALEGVHGDQAEVVRVIATWEFNGYKWDAEAGILTAPGK